MLLFFDTETTGLPRNWRAPITDTKNWPRMVQLAFLLFDEAGNEIDSGDYIIKPVGFTIPDDATRVHRISTNRALTEGHDLKTVLEKFAVLIKHSSMLVAHNIRFDEKIAGAEFIRMGMHNPIPLMRKICTMESTTQFCRLPGPYGYKWPKLSELHHKLFGSHFEEAHNAAADIHATARCYYELKNRSLI